MINVRVGKPPVISEPESFLRGQHLGGWRIGAHHLNDANNVPCHIEGRYIGSERTIKSHLSLYANCRREASFFFARLTDERRQFRPGERYAVPFRIVRRYLIGHKSIALAVQQHLDLLTATVDSSYSGRHGKMYDGGQSEW